MTENQELIFTQDTQKSFDSQTIDRRAFLKLPVEQRNALLAQQIASVAEYFRPGREEMEWTNEYVDDNISDE